MAVTSPLPVIGMLPLLLAWTLSTVAAAPTAQTAPARIISLGPNLTEAVFALGAGEQLVGVSDFCNWPPAARDLPRCGGYLDPNFEVISALKPDLILAQGRHHRVEEFARGRGIPVLMMEIDTIEQILDSLHQLGGVLSREDAANRLVADLNTRMDRLAGRVANVSEAERPKVFLVVSRRAGSLDQLSTVAGGSFLSQVLERAGGRNVFADVKQPYPQVSKESLLARQPDVVVEILPDREEDPARVLAGVRRDWQSLGSIPAVRSGSIHIVLGDYAVTPGPRFVQIIENLQGLLYPDLAPLGPDADEVTTTTESIEAAAAGRP